MSQFWLDYETRSRADLKKVGAYRYAEDASTRILMFAIASETEGPFLWFNPEFVSTDALSDSRAMAMLEVAFKSPESIIWAHNAEFERALSRYRALPDLGLKAPPIERWRCTAALARRAGLRASLGNVSEDLNLGQKKWGEGYQLIRLFSIPQKATGEFTDPLTEGEKFFRFGEYCLQDVRSEKEVHARLKPFELRGATLDTFLFDARMNDRGLPVNTNALIHAQHIITDLQNDVAAEFVKLTGLQPTQRDKVKKFFEKAGLKLANMQSKTLDDAIAYHDEEEDDEMEFDLLNDTPADIRHLLELYKMVSYAAVKKVRTMLDCVCGDGFIRGMFLYYGAGTGRWSGQKVQPQNFKKPTIKDSDGVYDLLCKGDSGRGIDLLYGNPLEAIANCIRNFIQDPAGEMYDADYSAVEARIICWLAGQNDALDRFRNGVDSYLQMAEKIYGRTCKNPSPERELAKRAVLGCGFGMWWPKFQKTCWDQARVKVSDELAERAVVAYRDNYGCVVQFWKGCEDAVRLAILKPGAKFDAGTHITFECRTISGMHYLLMTLPSGRVVSYPHPKIEPVTRKGGEVDVEGITYYGQIPGTAKWGRVQLYGGKLAENATQAVAADIMANGACNAEKAGFTIWGLIHDQALAKAVGGLQAFVHELTRLPPWAMGLPIKAEGRTTKYYRK